MERQPIDPKCEGCNKVINVSGKQCCEAYAYPSGWWRRGTCPVASHVKHVNSEQIGKKRVGQQKQKKNR